MSRTAKVIIWIVIILIAFIVGKVILGGDTAEAPSTESANMAEPSGADLGLTTSVEDASDTALDKDMASVDAEVNALGADGAAADEALATQ